MSGGPRFWDEIYSHGTDWGNARPTDILWAYLKDLSPGAKVLDVGCGTGRNALFLAKHGHNVTAIDISPIAIASLKASAQDARLPLEAICDDIVFMNLPTSTYDLVLMYGVINSLPQNSWTGVIDKIKQATKPGGVNVLAYFNRYSTSNTIDNCEVVALTPPNWALDNYADWLLIRHDCRCEAHAHGKRPVHQHVTERAGFRKGETISALDKTPEVVAVIGPTNTHRAEVMQELEEGALVSAATLLGTTIAASDRQLFCIPDGGVGRAAFDGYGSAGAHLPARVLAPRDDLEFANSRREDWISELRYPAVIERDVAWEHQALFLVQSVDSIISVGLSVGSLMEILWTKWLPRPIYTSLDVSPRIPEAIRRDILLYELPTLHALIDFISRKPIGRFR